MNKNLNPKIKKIKRKLQRRKRRCKFISIYYFSDKMKSKKNEKNKVNIRKFTNFLTSTLFQ